ncbi:MAG: lipoyl(octanoyl) transferase LipB [Gammaproteobacteria bacterium]|nr:lipoyl(octanoyl) transferase LipB [Gammaproteobacteria bacterium]
MAATSQPLIFRRLGSVDYLHAEHAMKQFTQKRTMEVMDEVWLLEHDPIYTTGVREAAEPKRDAASIPIIKTNRGGEMTYHGPGQLVAYFLLNIRKRRLGPRSLVNQLEELIIDFLGSYEVIAKRRQGAPGVYVGGKKIASLGLHTTATYCYHGISINVKMDLRPFEHIEVCGIPNLEMTQLSSLVNGITIEDALNRLEKCIRKRFSE